MKKYLLAALLTLSTTSAYAAESDPVLTFVHNGAYVCHSVEALEIAGNENAKREMGELNYMQAMVAGGCIQVKAGTGIQVHYIGKTPHTKQAAVGAAGNYDRLFAFSSDLIDKFGIPVENSTLHFTCRERQGALCVGGHLEY
jgi:hypothetical protein